jgi:photosystem II stability/assembly factor-like uncharacterized protein
LFIVIGFLTISYKQSKGGVMLSSTTCLDYSGKSRLSAVKAGFAGKKFLLLLVSFFTFSLFTFAQWTQIGSQLTGLTGGVPRISVVDSNVVWVAGGTGTSPKVYRTVDGGLNWVSLPTMGLPYFLSAVAAKDSETAFVADIGGPGTTGGNAKLFKTTNAGLNWILIDSSGGTTGWYNDIQFSKSNPDFGIAICDPANGPGGPYIVNKTTDGGATWVRTNPPGLPNSFSLIYVSYPIDPMFYGFAVVDITVILMTSYTTSDGGMTWVLGDLTVPIYGGDIVFNDDKQHGVMFGNEWPNIKVTSNGGNNWVAVNTGTDINSWCTASWVSGTNTIFICSYSSPSGKKIIRSDDNGLTWQQQVTPNLNIQEIDNIRYGNKFVGYALTNEGYVLKSIQDVSIVLVELEQSSPTTEFSLDQNYPNPFNPLTTIVFGLPVKSQVSLKIFNSVGEKISELVNEVKPSGNYTVEFNAANLPSGVYFYQLRAGDFIQTKKMLLVK